MGQARVSKTQTANPELSRWIPGPVRAAIRGARTGGGSLLPGSQDANDAAEEFPFGVVSLAPAGMRAGHEKKKTRVPPRRETPLRD